MDLSQVREKLRSGRYAHPVELLDDVWQTFTNARLFFRVTNEIHVSAIKVGLENIGYLIFFPMFIPTFQLREVFVADATPLFQELGNCCADNRELPCAKLLCFGCDRWVSWGQPYYAAPKYDYLTDGSFVMCNQCFKSVREFYEPENAEGTE